MVKLLRRWWNGPVLSLMHEFHSPPYGGGNQFLMALRDELSRRGIDVGANRIGHRTRACLFNSFNFKESQLRPLRSARLRRVHRVDGPVGRYRGTEAEVDEQICRVNNRYADATVFQSHYSLEAHQALGLSFRSPVVIPNAVDPSIFHPRGRVRWNPERRIKLISTSWSDNPNKGAATYKWLEENLDWARYNYTFVGRSPLSFDRIHAIPPQASRPLSDLLRQHDIYVAGSLHDPCSNALLEALACGLPAIHAISGGHPEIVGEAGLGFTEVEELPGRLKLLVEEYEVRQARIDVPSLTWVCDRYLEVLGLGSWREDLGLDSGAPQGHRTPSSTDGMDP